MMLAMVGGQMTGTIGRIFLGMAALLAAAATPSLAQTGADFYKGKTITYIVATPPGGGYDFWGRLVAEYMQKHLPGSTVVVKNMPGAGHLVGANATYAAKPDGLTIGSFNTGLIYAQVIKHDGAKFDLTKMSWIGKATTDPRVIAIASHSPIKTFDELRAQKEPVNFATSGGGTSSDFVEIHMLANVFKLNLKILTGYSGNERRLAMRRGEIAGTTGSRSSFGSFVQDGHGRFIAQIGGKDTDVPQLKDLAKDPAAKALVTMLQAQGDVARLTAGPPGIPQDRLDALRDAYRKAMEDPELQAKAEKLERSVEPAYGEEVAEMVKAALNQPPEIVELLKKTLEKPKTEAVAEPK
jgi:tripartite-type tricarboxylate transporter receptor subunit TctC